MRRKILTMETFVSIDFGKIWRKRCKQDACGEILNRL